MNTRSKRLITTLKISIHGVPRSGTSWLGEIFNSSPQTIYKYQPLFSYALKDFLNPWSSCEDIDAFFNLLRSTSDEFLDQSGKRSEGVLPHFEKGETTHLVYKEVRYHHILHNLMNRVPDLILLAIIRNPISVINSWLRAPREFRADLDWKPAEEWRYAPSKNQGKPEEFNGYEKWKEATGIFLELKGKFPGRVFVIRYEDLVKSPVDETRRMFDFCRLPFTDQTSRFIETSQNETHADAYSVFRKPADVGQGCSELDSSIVDFIRYDLTGTDLEVYLR